jgi:hypothetical protein
VKRSPLHNLGQSGAADGEVATWDDALNKWIPAASGISSTRLTYLTTTVGSTPDFVWDSLDEVVLTEVPA